MMDPGNEASALAQVERELETIFGNSGKQVVLGFIRRYDVSITDAIRRPDAFRMAIYDLLGELGSSLVMSRIRKRISEIAKVPGPKPSA